MTTERPTVILDPDYRLAIGIFVLSLPLLRLSVWAAGVVALFGLFLIVQTATLRLAFTATALKVYRGEQEIRHFSYDEWMHWQIYLPDLPILFYFREVRSIHFLPILFSAGQLRLCLENYVGMPPLSGQEDRPSEPTSEMDPTAEANQA